MSKENPQNVKIVSIFFKVPEELKTKFNKAIDDTNVEITQTKAIERLLRYFIDELSDDRKKELLTGRKLGHDPDHLLFDILGVTSPAEHFFQSGFYVPSIEFYEKVLKKSQNLPNLEEWARYKLGYCWNSLAENRREEAYHYLKANSIEQALIELELSIKCVDKSIDYYDSALKSTEEISPNKFILRYNLACAYSQKCQFYTELSFFRGDLQRYIDDENTYQKKLLDSKKERVHYEITAKIFDEIKKNHPSNPFSDKIRELYDKSIDQLKIIYKMITKNETNEGNFSERYNISWLTENMLVDSDLGFIRISAHSKSLFNDIYESLSSKGRTVRDWCLGKVDLRR